MKVKITRELLRDIKPGRKQQDIVDTEMQGFGVRVMPSGVISYIVRYRQKDGRQTRHAIGRYPTLSVTEAREEARQVLASITKGGDPKDRPKVEHSLQSFLEQEYKAWVATHHKNPDKTISRIKKCFSKFYARPLESLTPWVLERWRAECIKCGAKPSTINRDIVMLKGLLSVAVKFKQLREHPLKGFAPLKETDGEKVRFLSEDEEARLRAALDAREARERAGRASANEWRRSRGYNLLPDLHAVTFIDHLKPMVLLSLNTGMRQGEVFNLRWPQCDLARALLTIKGESAKSGKVRHIPLNEEAVSALREWRKQQPDDSGLVFHGQNGLPFNNVKKAWAKVLTDAKIDNFRWHDMRHHFASRLVMEGVDLNTVRELLGHADLKMTLRYAHLAPEHKAAAVAKLMRKAAPLPAEGEKAAAGVR